MMKQLFIKKWRQIALVSGLLVCLIVGIAMVVSSVAVQPTKLHAKVSSTHTTTTATSTPAAQNTGQETTSGSSPATSKSTVKSGATSAASSTNSASTPSQSPTNTEGIAKAATSQPTSVDVTLQINGKTAGNVTVASNANQCDVLSSALKQGVISDLDMRYFSSLASYGVYVINGQGDHDAVWWAYTVNGKSPPVGCSKQGVSGGEITNWIYTGK